MVDRTLASGTKTESLKTGGAKYIVLVKMQFDAGDERIWNGRGDISFDAGEGAGPETYTGEGYLGSISPIEESQEQRPFGVSITLSGLPLSKDFLVIAETENIIGRTVQVWLGFLDDNYVVIADPALVFQGLMDTMPISVGKTMTVTLNAENRLSDWFRARIRRFTDGSHIRRFPSDDGFEFVTDAVEREILWGGTVAGGTGGGAVSRSAGVTGSNLSSAGGRIQIPSSPTRRVSEK